MAQRYKGSRKAVLARLPLALYLDLHMAAKKQGLTLNDFVIWCIALGLETVEDGAKPRGF